MLIILQQTLPKISAIERTFPKNKVNFTNYTHGKYLMTQTNTPLWPLGRIFGFLTKQYIGYLAKRMEHTPISRYYFPLYLIGKNSGAISQQELADQLLTDKVSMVRILDNLTEDGYIERKVNPNDRRQHLLHITAAGKPWVEEIEQALRETDALFLEFLPETDRQLFLKHTYSLIKSTKDLPVEEVELFYNRINDNQHD
jgi:MarR family transcriptional regulator, transcriptional regulator for hemolysin